MATEAEWAERERKWAERERKRAEHRTLMVAQRDARNEELAVIAAKGMVAEFIAGDSDEALTVDDFLPWARAAIKALADDGIVFAGLGPADAD